MVAYDMAMRPPRRPSRRSRSLPLHTGLLTAEEERRLAHAIRVGRQADERRSRGIRTPDDDEVIGAAAQSRERFIHANVGLVHSIANRTSRPRYVDLDDLVQDGMIGLERAVDRFDERRGAKFSTYATWSIRESIQRGLERTLSSVRIPMRARRELRAALDGHDRHSGRVEQFLTQIQQLNAIDSTDRPLGDGGLDVGSAVVSPDPGPDEVVEAMEAADRAQRALAGLEATSRDVVESRFGLRGDEPATFVSIAARLGVSPQAVRKRLFKALADLRIQMSSSCVVSGVAWLGQTTVV